MGSLIKTLATLIPVVLGTSGLTGCGGGGDDDAPDPPANPANAAGIWLGTGSVAGSAVPYSVSALVTPDGHARIYLFSTDVPTTLFPTLIEGNLANSSGQLTLSSGGFYSGSVISGSSTGAATGRFDGAARTNFTGTVTLGSKTYNIDANYVSQYERPSSLATIVGVYTATTVFTPTVSYTITVAIDPAGTLTGSDSNGCVFLGSVTADLPTINAYGLSWNSSSCSAGLNVNGTFTGRMALLDSPTTNGAKVLAWYAHSATSPLVIRLPQK